MRTALWDRQGANIASRYKEMYCVELFSPLKAVSLDLKCRILLWFHEKRRWLMLVRWLYVSVESRNTHLLLAKGRLWNLLNGLEMCSIDLGINERGMRTHLSLSSCSYMRWYLQRVLLHSARRRSQCCAGLWQRSKESLCIVELIFINFKNKNTFLALKYWFPLAKKKKNTSKMFCYDPEHQWVLMPFPIILRE